MESMNAVTNECLPETVVDDDLEIEMNSECDPHIAPNNTNVSDDAINDTSIAKVMTESGFEATNLNPKIDACTTLRKIQKYHSMSDIISDPSIRVQIKGIPKNKL